MDDLAATRRMANAAMAAQATRLRVVTENLANTDTPGYRRKLVEFTTRTDPGGAPVVAVGPVRLSGAELPLVHDPEHPLADARGYYAGSGVEMLVELADARSAHRAYEANLRVFEQAREMGSALLELLRR